MHIQSTYKGATFVTDGVMRIMWGQGPSGPVPMAVSSSGGSTVSISGTTPTGNTVSAGSNISAGGPVTIPAGAISIEFLFWPDAVGTVNGISFDNTGTKVLPVYRVDSPTWKPCAALTYTLSAGTGALTIQT